MQNAQILWVDDQPEQIHPIRKFLQHDRLPVDIEIVESLGEAQAHLQRKDYHGIVVDLNMVPDDQYADSGAEWLLGFNDEYKHVPSFVYSAWLDDPIYESYVKDSFVIAAMSKNEQFSSPYSKHWFLSSLTENALRTLNTSVLPPEKIKFSDYLNNVVQYSQSVNSHWDRFGHWINKYIKRKGLAWIVMCGESIIKDSYTLKDFPNEAELMDPGRRHERIPFAYSDAYLPEQIGWQRLSDDDYYPSIMIGINGEEIQDDFDTGAVQTHISDKMVKRGAFDFIRGGPGVHLGDEYSFFTKTVSVSVETGQGSKANAAVPLAVVKEWDSSSFISINKKRRALIGRDILNTLGLVVTLDGHLKNSIIRGPMSRVLSIDSALFPPLKPYKCDLLNVDDRNSIYVEESGNPNGIPVLFVHGGPGGATNEHCRRFFDPKHYRIVLFDQRGCGKSSPQAHIIDNTTSHLIQDMEKIRVFLGIERWGLFGGSWGATLSLLYSQLLPDRVLWLVFRGVFLISKRELSWMYADGANNIFPDAWEEFITPIPAAERSDMIAAYYRRLSNDRTENLSPLAQSWMKWELAINHLLPLDSSISPERTKTDVLAFSRIETHYFVHGGFLERENQILNDTDKIKDIPTILVQGRYDLVCPYTNAFALSRVLRNVELIEVPLGGHSAFDINVCEQLVKATERMKRYE